MSNNTELQHAIARIERLEKAISHAIGGLDLAYESCSKRFTVETLLHIGHHRARLQNVLDGRPPSVYE